MTYSPAIHHRRSIRKPGFDYSQPGAYFVTICTQFRQFVLDDPVVAGIIRDVWLALPRWFPTIGLDTLAIMPNHGHTIFWLVVNPEDDGPVATPTTVTLLTPREPSIYIYGQPHDEGRPQGYAPTDDHAEGCGGRPQGCAPTDDHAEGCGRRPQGCAPTRDWIIPAVQTTNDRPDLGEVVGAWKSLVTTVYLDWLNQHDQSRRAKFWQRNYYDRIIRNDRMLWAVRQYIRDNPQNWDADPDNPTNHLNLPLPATIEDYLTDVRRHTPDP